VVVSSAATASAVLVVVEAVSEGDDVGTSVAVEIGAAAGGSVGAAVPDGSLPGLAVEEVEAAEVGEGEAEGSSALAGGDKNKTASSRPIARTSAVPSG
jgi:hypothetical protein